MRRPAMPTNHSRREMANLKTENATKSSEKTRRPRKSPNSRSTPMNEVPLSMDLCIGWIRSPVLLIESAPAARLDQRARTTKRVEKGVGTHDERYDDHNEEECFDEPRKFVIAENQTGTGTDYGDDADNSRCWA